MEVSVFQFEVLRKQISLKPLEIKIITGSMKPLIKIDEIVIVEKIETSKLKPFDIVIYHSAEKLLICHFIWDLSKLNPNHFLLGSMQNVNGLDKPVPQGKILGIVTNKKITLFYKIILLWIKMTT